MVNIHNQLTVLLCFRTSVAVRAGP